MKLQEIMVKEVVQAAPEESVAAAAKRMRERVVGCLVVTSAGAVKGIVTDRDLLDCLARDHDPYQCKVSVHMHRPVTVLRPEEEHTTAAAVMRSKRIKRLPIAKDGKLLGIVSMSDLARIASEEATRLRSSLSFFTAVVHAQSSQSSAVGASATGGPTRPAGSLVNSNSRLESLEIGGPG
jgi:signal-transduction protein with cAMP-binding, CBS, and nucleotidyltransferase domain